MIGFIRVGIYNVVGGKSEAEDYLKYTRTGKGFDAIVSCSGLDGLWTADWLV